MVYLLDVDGTITKPGHDLLFKGIVEKVNAIYAKGNTVWLFTCRPSNAIWENDLSKQGLRYEGIINTQQTKPAITPPTSGGKEYGTGG